MISKFKESDTPDAEGVNKALSRLASDPQAKQHLPPSNPIVEGRYEPQPLSISKLHYLTKGRGLERETVEKFLPFIRLVKDLDEDPSKACANIAFPLTKPGSDAVEGYEFRNYGLKSVAAGSDTQSGMWIADFAQEPARTKNVFFGESPIEIMSFYQLRRNKIDLQTSAFISVGRGMFGKQIRLALEHWPRPAKNTLFGNDYQGRLYDIRLAAAISGKGASIWRERESLLFTANGRRFEIPISKLSLNAFEKESGIRSGLHAHRARGGMSFNDIINTPIPSPPKRKKNWR